MRLGSVGRRGASDGRRMVRMVCGAEYGSDGSKVDCISGARREDPMGQACIVNWLMETCSVLDASTSEQAMQIVFPNIDTSPKTQWGCDHAFGDWQEQDARFERSNPKLL